jgi:hypothetical protein
VWFQVHGSQPFEGLAETDRAIPFPAALRDNRPLLFESYYEAAFAVRPGENIRKLLERRYYNVVYRY